MARHADTEPTNLSLSTSLIPAFNNNFSVDKRKFGRSLKRVSVFERTNFSLSHEIMTLWISSKNILYRQHLPDNNS